MGQYSCSWIVDPVAAIKPLFGLWAFAVANIMQIPVGYPRWAIPGVGYRVSGAEEAGLKEWEVLRNKEQQQDEPDHKHG